MITGKKSIAVVCVIILVAQLCQVPLVFGQVPVSATYRVGAGDRILVSVPQRPDLNRSLEVQQNGNITLPLAGDIAVSGLTAAEIQIKIFQALKDFYPSITGVEVTITETLSQTIYVIGQVGAPGKYSFATAPNLWEAIREAGGPLPTASLDNVRIVKDRSKGGGSSVFNVQIALEKGHVDQLPDVEGGDTVIIEERAEMYTGSLGVNVFGAVVNPGTYKLQGRGDLMSAILLAGGPQRVASLGDIKIIRPLVDRNIVTFKVDLNNYLKEGDPASNPKLRAGDTVHIPERSRLSRIFTDDIGILLSLVTTGVTVAALIVTIRQAD